MNDQFSYDALPYPSFTFAQTHPDRLATMATFYGMEPADPEKCRVLELGCGDGANLLAMAYVLPGSEFVGLDLSDVHINDAKNTSSQLGIKNASFLKEDVTDFDAERFGTFDYIIAHGLFSWVPDFVRSKILEVYGKCLAPNGVGYISYNAYPGCRIREILWGMMQFHTRAENDPRTKVKEGVEFIGELADTVEADSLYETLLDLELEAMEDRSVSNIYHDDLSACNQPFYFYQFVDRIEDHGFQYLSESDAASMNPEKLSKAGRELLKRFGDDLIRREQYLDFVQCRRFRSTLFCRSEVALDRDPEPAIIEKFYIASNVKAQPTNAAVNSDGPQKFLGSNEASLEINHPLTKATLTYLGSVWARSVSFDELLEESSNLLGRDRVDLNNAEIKQTSAYLIRLFQAGFVKLHRFRPNFAGTAGDLPKTSDFARWQIARGSESVTTLTGLNLKPEFDAVRLLISLSDGTRDRKALAEAMLERLDVPVNEKQSLREQLPELIESNLQKMVESGLLIP